MTQILVNRIITPDGTILDSRHRHDYKSYVDTITGETYMVDGGIDYCRSSVNNIKATRILITVDDPHDIIREHFTWGSYGKNGDEPLHYIELRYMTKEHISAILATQHHIPRHISDVFVKEIIHREENHNE